eukprot:7074467-Prymnesium_polylepis.1
MTGGDMCGEQLRLRAAARRLLGAADEAAAQAAHGLQKELKVLRGRVVGTKGTIRRLDDLRSIFLRLTESALQAEHKGKVGPRHERVGMLSSAHTPSDLDASPKHLLGLPKTEQLQKAEPEVVHREQRFVVALPLHAQLRLEHLPFECERLELAPRVVERCCQITPCSERVFVVLAEVEPPPLDHLLEQLLRLAVLLIVPERIRQVSLNNHDARLARTLDSEFYLTAAHLHAQHMVAQHAVSEEKHERIELPEVGSGELVAQQCVRRRGALQHVQLVHAHLGGVVVPREVGAEEGVVHVAELLVREDGAEVELSLTHDPRPPNGDREVVQPLRARRERSVSRSARPGVVAGTPGSKWRPPHIAVAVEQRRGEAVLEADEHKEAVAVGGRRLVEQRDVRALVDEEGGDAQELRLRVDDDRAAHAVHDAVVLVAVLLGRLLVAALPALERRDRERLEVDALLRIEDERLALMHRARLRVEPRASDDAGHQLLEDGHPRAAHRAQVGVVSHGTEAIEAALPHVLVELERGEAPHVVVGKAGVRRGVGRVSRLQEAEQVVQHKARRVAQALVPVAAGVAERGRNHVAVHFFDDGLTKSHLLGGLGVRCPHLLDEWS